MSSKLIEIDKEIEVIKKISHKFLELKSLSKLESYCLQSKILSKNNIDFSISTLKTIISNPVYAPNDKVVVEYFKNKGVSIYAEGDRAKFDGRYGLMVYGKKDNEIKDWIVSVGLHKPGIEKGIDWVRMQQLLEKNKDKRYRANCKHDFLFSGILRCSECGSYMRPKIAQGERFYYVCELKEKSRGKRCNSKNITGLALDKVMIKKLEEIIIPNYNIYKELSEMAIKRYEIDVESREEELKKKFKSNTKSIQNLIDKLKHMDVQIIDIVNDELKKIKEENNKIQDELAMLKDKKINKIYLKNEELQIKSIVSDVINNCFKTFEKLDIKLRKDILSLIIEDMKGSGQNVDVKILNKRINQSDKRLFSDMIEETTNKNK